MKIIEKIHQANLEILLEVDRICRKHKIEYRLDAGTLIGAVRHKGFIPWDDDVDIAFLRKDYEAFIQVAPQELKKGLHIWFPDKACNGKVFYDFTPKIIYENSRKCAPNQETAYYGEELNHICVDLFILDEIADSGISQKLQILKMKVIYGMAMAHRYQLDLKKYKGISKFQVAVLAALGKLVPMPIIYKLEKQTARAQENGKRKTLYWSNYQPDYVHLTIPKEAQERAELEFEGHRLLVPKDWHKVLSAVYGDYMTPPPKEKQIATHGDIENQDFFVQVSNQNL